MQIAARIAALSAQLNAGGKLEVLAPEQVGNLMGGLLRQLESGMPTLHEVSLRFDRGGATALKTDPQ